MADDIIVRDSNNHLAVNTVSSTEANVPYNYDDCFTLDTNGKRALRVVVDDTQTTHIPASVTLEENTTETGATATMDVDGFISAYEALYGEKSADWWASLLNSVFDYEVVNEVLIWGRHDAPGILDSSLIDYFTFSGLPEEGAFNFKVTSYTPASDTSYTPAKLPELPSSDGTYVLKCVVSGTSKTLSWVSE